MLKLHQPSAPSGVYVLDPDGDGGQPAFAGYCDQTTDGGGWTLVLAYAHIGGENVIPVAGTQPTDPVGGYSHASTLQLQALPFDESRWYCETSLHTRRIHFKSASAGITSYMRGLGANSVSIWQSGFTLLPGHTAFLPGATGSVFDVAGEDRMTEFPFWLGSTYHWGIGGLGNRFECDDFAAGPANTTLHQVWVR